MNADKGRGAPRFVILSEVRGFALANPCTQSKDPATVRSTKGISGHSHHEQN
jgi:hypothetical protein